MKSKFKQGDQVTCGNKENCTIMDVTWLEHMDEYQYLIWWNESFATVLERDLNNYK